MFNMERLLPTSPKALGEVLTTKSYNFIKPKPFRAGLGRILGVGILLAEGDEHKVCNILVDVDVTDQLIVDATQESYASVQLPSCKRFISNVLVEVEGICREFEG